MNMTLITIGNWNHRQISILFVFIEYLNTFEELLTVSSFPIGNKKTRCMKSDYSKHIQPARHIVHNLLKSKFCTNRKCQIHNKNDLSSTKVNNNSIIIAKVNHREPQEIEYECQSQHHNLCTISVTSSLCCNANAIAIKQWRLC